MSSSIDSKKRILNQSKQEQSEQNEADWVMLSLTPQSPNPISIPNSPLSPTSNIANIANISNISNISNLDLQYTPNSESQHIGWIKNTGTIPFWLKWMYLSQISSRR